MVEETTIAHGFHTISTLWLQELQDKSQSTVSRDGVRVVVILVLVVEMWSDL